jgi:alkylation response protein AidB-like acyl-CoA dehydrogenase
MLRDSARRFFEREVAPYHRQWEKDGGSNEIMRELIARSL